MKTYRFIPLIVLAFFTLSACQLSQSFSFLSTPTSTPTNTSTPTFTPTNTLTPTPTSTNTPVPPTPTITPVPITIGQWRGIADGWNPPLTISFNVTADGGNDYVNHMVIFIPNVDTTNYLVQTRCTIKIDKIDIENGTIKFMQGDITVFDAQFTNAKTINGNIYGGWLCQNKVANFGVGGSYVTWHAEWRKP